VSIFGLCRAGNVPDIVRAALDEVSVGPIIRLMPWAKILSSAPQEFHHHLCSRVQELLQTFIRCTPKSGRTSAMSVALETSINTSRINFMNTLESNSLFSEVTLMTAAFNVVMKSDAVSFALHQCMIPVYETAQRESA
jgi:hypothetical protein